MMSKFILCSDLHIRSNRPQFRKDDYLKTALNKFQQIIDLANENKADILCAGDFFDNVRVGHKVVNNVIDIIKKLEKKLYIILGQHDMSFHSDNIESSPIKTILFQDNVELLNRRKYIHKYGIKIYGCSWGEKPLIAEDENSILVIHKSITPKEIPFFLPDAVSAKDAMRKWKYKYIVSGDFHQPFCIKKKEQILVNTGPMLRQKIDEVDLIPVVWLLDVDSEKLIKIPLNIELSDNVFALDKVKKKEESLFSDELNDLVLSLKNNSEKPDYKQIVNMVVKKTNPGKEVEDKINEIMGGIIG